MTGSDASVDLNELKRCRGVLAETQRDIRSAARDCRRRGAATAPGNAMARASFDRALLLYRRAELDVADLVGSWSLLIDQLESLGMPLVGRPMMLHAFGAVAGSRTASSYPDLQSVLAANSDVRNLVDAWQLTAPGGRFAPQQWQWLNSYYDWYVNGGAATGSLPPQPFFNAVGAFDSVCNLGAVMFSEGIVRSDLFPSTGTVLGPATALSFDAAFWRDAVRVAGGEVDVGDSAALAKLDAAHPYWRAPWGGGAFSASLDDQALVQLMRTQPQHPFLQTTLGHDRLLLLARKQWEDAYRNWFAELQRMAWGPFAASAYIDGLSAVAFQPGEPLDLASVLGVADEVAAKERLQGYLTVLGPPPPPPQGLTSAELAVVQNAIVPYLEVEVLSDAPRIEAWNAPRLAQNSFGVEIGAPLLANPHVRRELGLPPARVEPNTAISVWEVALQVGSFLPVVGDAIDFALFTEALLTFDFGSALAIGSVTMLPFVGAAAMRRYAPVLEAGVGSARRALAAGLKLSTEQVDALRASWRAAGQYGVDRLDSWRVALAEFNESAPSMAWWFGDVDDDELAYVMAGHRDVREYLVANWHAGGAATSVTDDLVAEMHAQARLQVWQRWSSQQFPGLRPHWLDRHGPQVTREQLMARATTGVDPVGVLGRPTTSTRFVSSVDMERALQEAERIMREQPDLVEEGGLYLRFDHVVGEGYFKLKANDPVTDLVQTDLVLVKFDAKTNQVYTAFAEIGTPVSDYTIVAVQ